MFIIEFINAYRLRKEGYAWDLICENKLTTTAYLLLELVAVPSVVIGVCFIALYLGYQAGKYLAYVM
jgi:hypothetical protein